ncbi:MAG: trigger factor [Deltaproteobacteria bacterium]|nr:trigger factor [Deltaproteobacteria bacterium]
MKISVEDISPVKKRLIIEVPSEDIDKELDAAYSELAATVSIDGFRKGRVPKAVLEKRYKDHVFGEVVSKVIENSYPKAVQGNNINPVSRPDIEVKAGIERGRSFSYIATVEVRPSINVDGYIGMELKKGDVTVSDDEAEKSMELLREGNAHFSEVERPAIEKDMVVIDFEGFIGGKSVENAKASEYPAVIGTNTLVPEIEQVLPGMKKGDEKDVHVKFPQGYGHKKLAGKEALFKVKVKAVKERVLPALDDEFAKDLKLDNIAQLKDKVREAIIKQKEAAEKEEFKKEILEKLIEKNTFDSPPALVAGYLQSFVSQAIESIKNGRVKPEDAAEMAPERLKEKYSNIAEMRVKEEMILDAVARQENITVAEDEINLRIQQMAEQRHQRFDDVKRQLMEQGSDSMLAAQMLEEKVFDFIIEKAKMQRLTNR